MATQIATRQPTTLSEAKEQFRQSLGKEEDGLRALLPSHISPEKFQRTVMTAVQADPDLLKADRRSLIMSCMKAAQDGLLPDKREAALVIFNTRQKDAQGQWISVKQVQYMPMVYGLRKKILQSGEVADLQTAVVYRAEVESGSFLYEAGTEAMLRHRPMLELETADDDIVCAYSVATMKDGTKSFEVMRRSEINKVREQSQTGATHKRNGEARTPSGPWVDWFAEQCRKTVMRRHSKSLPQSGDIVDVEAHDDALASRTVQAALAVVPDAPTALPPSRSDDDPFDADTGEVTDENGGQDEDAEREAAMAADREGFAEMDGTDDPRSSSERHRDGFIGQIEVAEGKAALDAIDKAFVAVRATMDDGDAHQVQQALATAREGE